MFKIQHIKNKSKTSNYLEVSHSDTSVYAKIDLNLGGSLQELILKNQIIISGKVTGTYEESYASAILFPFANRIENGQYNFNETIHQLPINKTEENNAIHGLVYNKTFTVVHYESYENEAVIYVRYVEKNEPVGFPFKYIITLSYVIKKASVELEVSVKNSDEVSFPFTIGWHPYFVSNNLEKSYLNFDCTKKILVNDQKIPTSEESIDFSKGIQIDNREMDDCFILDKNHICLTTPSYQLDFDVSTDGKYLHIYIPPNRKTIAIEPQTGSANNFNDNRGLKLLLPQELYEIRWKIEVNSKTN